MTNNVKQRFDVNAFIRGVDRPTRALSLCTDPAARTRVDQLMDQISALPKSDDESLAGDPRRDELMAELKTLAEGPGWVEFVVRAPTHTAKVRYQSALSDAEKGDNFTERLIAAEASMVADCLASIDGNPVNLTVEQAHRMLESWPEDLTNEIVDAVNDLGGSLLSVPFSRRLSQTLGTQGPVGS